MTEHETRVAADWINADRTEDLRARLVADQQIDCNEHIQCVTSAGEGNMNCTLRVETPQRSVVVKQSRPWVEKYPSIPAPVDRILFECQFYQAIQSASVIAKRMPNLLGVNREQYLLYLEDLGASQDGSVLYKSPESCDASLIAGLVDWLVALHGTSFDLDPARHRNWKLRLLNHAHVFEIPFHQPSAIDLDAITPGLGKLAAAISANARLLDRVATLGSQYLQDGPCLLHGDFFPGSWLLCTDQTYIIDPEFSFFGCPEFDLAILCAHLKIAGLDQQAISTAIVRYEDAAGPVDRGLWSGWMGVEVLRRLLGVAQLPMERSLSEKQQLLDWAVMQCLSGE